MQLAIKESLKAGLEVYPNPKVGAVIVNNNKILSTGFHKKYGAPHAEQVAINNLNSSLPPSATLYVTLEPCCHKGKTDPCTDLIIKNKFHRVVIGSMDPNPLAGGGARILKENNIQVDEGICNNEIRSINKRFLTFYEKKRPYIILKMACTLDGYIAEPNGHSKWITNSASRASVHKLRSSCDAILVGRKTIEKDNPSLTSHGKGKDPRVILVDSNSKLNTNFNVFRNNPIIFTKDQLVDNPRLNIINILTFLFNNSYKTLLVEGGGKTFSYFLDYGFYDELQIYYGSKFIGSGIPIYYGKKTLEEGLNLTISNIEHFDNDIKITYQNKI